VRAVGASKEQAVDVRVVAATHRDLRNRARSGEFREDLLYRLDVVTIEIPPLRHRREDVAVLAERFLERSRAKHPQSPVQRLSRDAMARLMEHAWPGNVRELAHAIERTVVLGRAVEAQAADLPTTVTAGETLGSPFPSADGAVLPIREVQRRYAAWALDRHGGHKTRTAEALGVDTKTLAKWLSEEE
jgi:two-component system response regulator HydG